jgi:membrane-associated phospholipid phosphatase
MLKRFFYQNSLFFLPLFIFILLGYVFVQFFTKGEEVLFCSENRNAFLNHFFYLINFLGEAYFYFIFGLIYLFYKHYKIVLFLILTGITVLVFSQVLKMYFSLPRPAVYFAEVLKLPGILKPVPGVELAHSFTTSFPSGHTMSAFALYGFMAFVQHKTVILKFCYWILALLAALARIYLGQHFLTDVLAGAFFGTLVASSYYLVFQFTETKKML